MRHAHVLRYNRKVELPNYIIFVDTETKPLSIRKREKSSKLWIGDCAYVYRNKRGKYSNPVYYSFTDYDDFWRYVSGKVRSKIKLYVFAHNWSFDYPVLLTSKWMQSNGWKQGKAIIEGPPTYIQFNNNGASIAIIDSLNYFRASLAVIGASMGFDKLRMPSYESSIKDWHTYLRRDVDVLMKAVLSFIDFIRENDLGNFQITLAAQSFVAFRHRFMKHRILIDCNSRALDLARKAYHGGRVECYKIGKIRRKLYLLDINSQYPYIMRNHLFPAELYTTLTNISLAELNKLLNEYVLIAEVDIETDIPIYPIKHNNRLIFPIGKFRVVLTQGELVKAYEMGHIKKVLHVGVYSGKRLFRDFVDFFYPLRKKFIEEGNAEFAYMTKIILNSLYGKWGQHGRVFTDVGDAEDYVVMAWNEIDIHTGNITSFRKFNGKLQIKGTEGESFNSHPAIAATITGYARMLLWQYMSIAGKGDVFYCDTDSLLVNKAGKRKLEPWLISDELGMLKVEGKFSEVTLFGAKDYEMGDRKKIKGIKKNAVIIKKGKFRQDQFVSFKGMIRRGNLNEQVIKSVDKNLTRIYQKGIIGIDGVVTPIVLNTR
ncbi:hypothetical protein LCGC14_1128060 [marine sediment metagenome]|uniref:DNA-directed DNA polymerase n=1 Tax=marine sediment metagenome TaxID=412755 RepID=A0A0F9PK47_9ZZZZ